MTDLLKIMFWNIQNIYELELIDPPDDQSEQLKQSMRLFNLINSRKKIAGVIDKINPDIVIMVELSIGKVKIGDNSTDPIIKVDHLGPAKYMIDLNDGYKQGYFESGGKWQSVISRVNCTDVLVQAKESDKIESSESNEKMFEYYGILWKSDKLGIKSPATSSSKEPEISIINKDNENNYLPFAKRAPGFVIFLDATGKKELFPLVMIHSAYDEDGKKAKKTIEYLSQLKEVQNTKVPLIIAGDFNLDYGENKAAFGKLISSEPAGLGMTVTIGDKKSTRVWPTDPLQNAFDQIFTRGFNNNHKDPGVYNFAEEDFGGDYDKARWLSDHLPVFVTVSLSK